QGRRDPRTAGDRRRGGAGDGGRRMTVTVRYMAQLRTAAGVAAESVSLADQSAARDLLARLAEQHGEPLGRLLRTGTVVVFVNDSQVEEDTAPLRDGDVVTLLSPIAGG